MRVGTVVARRYRIDAQLGRGGMGAVYRAHDLELGEDVALKTLAPELAEDEAFVTRFRREVRLARRVTHRNVARTFDLGEHDGTLFLTMELVEGRDLHAILREGTKYTPAAAVALGRQIAEGLAAAHEAGVVHRDLKPANVFVEANTGRVVLMDFGIARSIEDVDRSMVISGTPGYMAPEQIAGLPLDARADLFALGLILYEALTAKRAMGGIPLDQRLRLDGPEPLGVPAGLARLVSSLSRADRELRPSSAREVIRRLERALDEVDATTADLRGPIAPLAQSDDAVVRVVPFRYRGPEDHAYLGDELAEQIVDVLARTRGLKVLAPRVRDDAIARNAKIVEGTVLRRGDEVRVNVRMIEGASSEQIWSERFDGRISDVLDFSDALAQHIAEMLRLQLDTVRYARTGAISDRALDRYLYARALMRKLSVECIPELEAVVAEAPDFPPAAAALAFALSRVRFFPGYGDRAGTAERAVAALTRAQEIADRLPETHVADSVMALHEGQYRRAIAALVRAIEIAPTYAPAQEQLGRLQLEAGRAKEGMERVMLAVQLDPLTLIGLLDVARQHALDGDFDACDRVLARFAERDALGGQLPSRYRIAMWRGDPAARAHVLAQAKTRAGDFYVRVFGAFERALRGEIDGATLRACLKPDLERPLGLRYQTFYHQICAEVLATMGEPAHAFEEVESAAMLALTDLEWLDRCPVLDRVRALPGFAAIRQTVRVRVDAIWSV